MEDRKPDSNNKSKKNDRAEEKPSLEYSGDDDTAKDIPNWDELREICENPF